VPASLPRIPKTAPEFEPNEAFADFDSTMLSTVKSLLSVIKSAPFNSTITEAQLGELANGKLGTKPLPAEWAELQNVAKLLGTAQGKTFKAQLGNPINATVLEAAPRVGFPKAHEAMLKTRLTTFAGALDGVLKPLLKPDKTIDLLKLRSALNNGRIAGKTLEELVPDKAAREQLVDAMGMITDNRRLFATVGTMSPDQLKKLVAGQEVAHKDGTYDWKVKLSDVVSATLPVKPGPEPTVDIHDPKWKAKIPVLLSEYQAFLKDRKMVPFHEAWHSKNGSGGVNGATSGEWFQHFHAHMGGDFVEWLKMRGKTDAALVKGTNGEYALPDWADMTKDMPEGFYKPGQPKNIGWEVPDILKRKTSAPLTGRPFMLDGQKITSLDDIKTLDGLGRVLGETGAHAVAHVELGGGMAGFKSVAEPAFVLWHYGAMEKIRHEWLKTDNGKTWQAANPLGFSEPFLDTHDKVMGDVTRQRVAIITAAEEAEPMPRVGATRGARSGPVGAAAPAPKRTKAQILREAKQQAEELCTSDQYARGANEVLFTKDQIFEAAAGFKKGTPKHAEGVERTERVRSRGATRGAVSEPWGGEGRR